MILTGSCMVRTREPHTEYLLNAQRQPLWWSNLPINVYFDLHTMTEDQVVLSQTAFHLWNGAIGHKVFEVFPQTMEADPTLMTSLDNSIFVTVDHLRRVGGIQRLGLCQYDFTKDRFGQENGIRSVTILLHDELEWYETMFIMLHEAGHALGLRHDLNQRSIMYKAPMGSNMEFEEKDLEFIRTQITVLELRQRGFREAYQ